MCDKCSLFSAVQHVHQNVIRKRRILGNMELSESRKKWHFGKSSKFLRIHAGNFRDHRFQGHPVPCLAQPVRHLRRGPYKPCTGRTGQCMNMHRPHWLHRPYSVYMAVLYTTQEAVKLSQMLMKSTHRPHRLPQQTRIGRRTAETSNMVYRDVGIAIQQTTNVKHTYN